MRPAPTARIAALSLAASLTAGALVGCGKKDEPAPEPSPAPSLSAVTSAATSSSASSASAASPASAASSTPSSTAASSRATAVFPDRSTAAAATGGATRVSTAKGSLDRNESVEKAHETFGGLVPDELFARFSTCDSTGIKDSFNCSGPEVGQFQFFKSDAKAAQATQVLTELRSSRVVLDTGDRVVGWSTLGTTAVLTVVDNQKGLVMQQMLSTDQEDPREKIEELGLAAHA